MKVFVVMAEIKKIGGALVGVYSTNERAAAVAYDFSVKAKEQYPGVSISCVIEPREIDV